MDKLPEFIAQHPWLFLIAAVVIGLIIINEWRIHTRGFVSLLPSQAVQWINQDAKVLDIRGESVFAKGHIVNALHMPADKVAAVVKKITDKNQQLLVCCDSGYQCARVASVLVKDGYANVATLRGGMQAWIQDKLPLSK